MTTEFLFITANDIHISDSNPRSRIDNFKESILDKLGQMRNACNKLAADGAIIAGDLFNIKNPAKNSHQLNQDLIRLFRQFKCPVYMIEGNHDLTANSLDSLTGQPLGVLFEDQTLIRLREERIEKNGVSISLVGIPYQDNLDLGRLKFPDRGNSVARIAAMHLYASPKADDLFGTKIHGYDEFLHLDADVFVIGHYHIDQGVVEHGGKWFVNIGALSRGTLREENIEHHPQIGFIKILAEENKVSFNVQPIKLKIKPASEIFDLEKREEEKKEAQEIEIFVDKLVSDSADIDRKSVV